MKIAKCLLPIILCFVFLFVTACSGSSKSSVEKAIRNELDLLKNLDTSTTQKYISYREIFPDATEEAELSDPIQEVFSLFFQNFGYKILDIEIDTKANTATARLRLNTIDARSLAEDYSKSLLESSILSAAESESQSTNDLSPSIEARYLLLYQHLKNTKYKTMETDCSMQLTRASNDSEIWEIKRTSSLENDLIGGFMTYLSETDIISPEETMQIYLDTLEEMNLKQMSNFLGISSLLQSEDNTKNEIAAALVEQVHSSFQYEIKESKAIDGYNAVVRAEITTFDSDAILNEYQNELDTYLASTEAVIDGSALRIQKSYDMLLNVIKNNEAVRTSITDFHLTNDGVSWKLTNPNEELGSAIFGTLVSTPMESGEES